MTQLSQILHQQTTHLRQILRGRSEAATEVTTKKMKEELNLKQWSKRKKKPKNKLSNASAVTIRLLLVF